MKQLFVKLLLGLSCLLYSYVLLADTEINDAQIISGTIQGASDCIHYQVVGICFWLRCTTFECHIEKTLKLDQYLPDTVVSVFTKHDNNPWTLAKMAIDPGAYRLGKVELKQFTPDNMGFGDSHDDSSLDINNHFHEVDIIGNPALAIFGHMSMIMLPSSAKPYAPYYLSLLDSYAWRFPGLDKLNPGAFIPGIRDVGTMVIHDWGPIFPRNGFVNQPDDAKAGAVVAQRAADIITQGGQPHLYQMLSNTCGEHCRADSVKENNKQTQFQMIYPKLETKCIVFGESDVGNLKPWGTDYSQAGNNRYVWVLWRHYRGCVPDKGAKYLGSISF